MDASVASKWDCIKSSCVISFLQQDRRIRRSYVGLHDPSYSCHRFFFTLYKPRLVGLANKKHVFLWHVSQSQETFSYRVGFCDESWPSFLFLQTLGRFETSRTFCIPLKWKTEECGVPVYSDLEPYGLPSLSANMAVMSGTLDRILEDRPGALGHRFISLNKLQVLANFPFD